jgi:hypothetical protein
MNDYYYLNSEEPVELTLFLRHITDDEIIYETDDNDDNKFYLKVGCMCNRFGCSWFINSIKRYHLSTFYIETNEENI